MRAFHENVRFCPKCGVESLDRDFSHQAAPRLGGGGEPGRKQVKAGTEWCCRTCGFGFCIKKSIRWETSEELHARERKLRNGVRFTTESVGTEIARKYSEEFEP
jgi:hypothetical protein